jgi:hypothetical protein
MFNRFTLPQISMPSTQSLMALPFLITIANLKSTFLPKKPKVSEHNESEHIALHLFGTAYCTLVASSLRYGISRFVVSALPLTSTYQILIADSVANTICSVKSSNMSPFHTFLIQTYATLSNHFISSSNYLGVLGANATLMLYPIFTNQDTEDKQHASNIFIQTVALSCLMRTGLCTNPFIACVARITLSELTTRFEAGKQLNDLLSAGLSTATSVWKENIKPTIDSLTTGSNSL